MVKMNIHNVSSNLSGSSKETHKYSASRYALQVALQTMKERCEKLQTRLSCLEEENLQLRIEKHKLSVVNRNEATLSVSSFEKKIAELSRQKSQLSHHILMVATENKELWQRLSKLTEENESLSNHLNLSDSLNKQQTQNLKPDKSIDLVNSCSRAKGKKEDSLEEISLKVINSLSKGKNQNEEMSELHNGTVSIDQCGFTLDENGKKETEGDESLLNEMKEIIEGLKMDKAMLKQQQESLKSVLTTFKKVADGGIPCKKCILRAKEDEARQEAEKNLELNKASENFRLQAKGSSQPPSVGIHFQIPSSSRDLNNKDPMFEERICPLCTKFYHSSTPFDDFNEHVLSHFVEEENTEDSFLTNCEVIT